jgi:hypothetical protein
VPRISTPLLVWALILVALLWFLSVQFYTGCHDGGCSAVREAIGWLRFPLAVVWLLLVVLAVTRLWARRR